MGGFRMLYRFKCKNCGYETTKVLSVDERNQVFDCPECKQKNSLVRQIPKSMQFKFSYGQVSQDNLHIEDRN